jgi:hypothetical protein
MPNRDFRAEIVKSGVCLYAGSVPSEAWIVKQNFEYHFEEDEQEAEILIKDGECFAVIIARDGKKIGRGSEEMSLSDAVTSAERLIRALTWDDRVLQKPYGGRLHSRTPLPSGLCKSRSRSGALKTGYDQLRPVRTAETRDCRKTQTLQEVHARGRSTIGETSGQPRVLRHCGGDCLPVATRWLER